MNHDEWIKDLSERRAEFIQGEIEERIDSIQRDISVVVENREVVPKLLVDALLKALATHNSTVKSTTKPEPVPEVNLDELRSDLINFCNWFHTYGIEVGKVGKCPDTCSFFMFDKDYGFIHPTPVSMSNVNIKERLGVVYFKATSNRESITNNLLSLQRICERVKQPEMYEAFMKCFAAESVSITRNADKTNSAVLDYGSKDLLKHMGNILFTAQRYIVTADNKTVIS